MARVVARADDRVAIMGAARPLKKYSVKSWPFDLDPQPVGQLT